MFARLAYINGRTLSTTLCTRKHSRSTAAGVPNSALTKGKTALVKSSLPKMCMPHISNQVQLRNASICVEVGTATFEDVRSLSRQRGKWLIDVREPNEVLSLGAIPSSVNIPLSVILKELAPKDRGAAYQFKKKYGRPFPTHDTELVFYCTSGHRSYQAAQLAVALGYTQVKNYKGSWNDWTERVLEVDRD